MRTIYLLAIVLIAVFIYSCKKDISSTKIINKEILQGRVQKGPFINGTNITIFELNSNYEQTGKVFSTQINDNIGSFIINHVNFASQYVELQANGFYFNEVTGNNSDAQLALSAITDLADSSTININILTTLEKKRVEYLLSKGKSFREAKTQARTELVKVFNITKTDIISPEYLDISKQGDDNAILLAISLITQGYRTEAELTELIANIGEDIKTDGKIDNALLGTALINHAKVLDTTTIRENLTAKYSSFKQDFIIPNFEKYLKNFIDSTGFVFTDLIEYPDSGKSGYNLLSYNKFDYSAEVSDGSTYKLSIAAHVPKLASIKVRLKFNVSQSWSINSINSGWTTDFNWDTEPNVFYFTKDNSREDLDLQMNLRGTGSARIEIYENKNISPMRIKEITW